VIEAFFSGIAGDVLKYLVSEFQQFRSERSDALKELETTFGPIDHLVPYYVVPYGQNVNP
jgi:hypothetical protein